MPLVSTRRLQRSIRWNGLLFHSFVSVPFCNLFDPFFLFIFLFVIVAPARLAVFLNDYQT